MMERLRSHEQFVAVLRRRRKVSERDIVLHYRMRPVVDGVGVPERRLGLAVSKGVGNAVTRNRVKRRFRVLAARHQDELPEGIDVVLRAKPSAATADFASLDGQVDAAFRAVSRRTEQQ